MVDLSQAFNVLKRVAPATGQNALQSAPMTRAADRKLKRVGYVDGALGGADRLEAVKGLFPDVFFENIGKAWPQRMDVDLDALIIGVDASLAAGVEKAQAFIAGQSGRVVVALLDADLPTTRQLIRAGAADVLPMPVGEPALVLCLERLLNQEGEGRKDASRPGDVIAFLKAGGGVGATALACQMATTLAGRDPGTVCLADLDLQFGSADVYLDLPGAATVSDVLGWGAGLESAPFRTALQAHASGLRLLAAPKEIMPLETLTPVQVEALVRGLRQNFRTTFVDLPSVWTAWTHHLIQQASSIVLVTNLSVAHVQLAKRQLTLLAAQRLDDRPIHVVCNAVSPEQTASLSIKDAQRSLGRTFDLVLPYDARTMVSALNQGVDLAAIRRGTPLEKAVTELAGKLAADAPRATAIGRR